MINYNKLIYDINLVKYFFNIIVLKAFYNVNQVSIELVKCNQSHTNIIKKNNIIINNLLKNLNRIFN